MHQLLWRIIGIIVVTLLMPFLTSLPVYAIVNPDAIDFGTGSVPWYKVFYNVRESNDMLFVAEGYVHYVVPPTDYTAEEAFLFEVLDVGGASTLISTHLYQYENRPIAIYQTAAQVAALGLAPGTAYVIRITGNPTIFAAPAGNTVQATLTASDYVNQLLGVDGSVATDNPLRNFLITMADHIETNDAPPAGSEYIVPVFGVRYLTITGGSIFMEGMPGVSTYCPILFQAGVEVLEGDTPESTGTYAGTLTAAQQWGQTTANGLTMLGVWLGINQALAGSVVLFGLGMMLVIYVYKRTQSGIVVILMASVVPFVGAYVGLMPMALAFIFVIFIITLMSYFFLSRGAL